MQEILTGLRFNVETAASELKGLKIRMKHTLENDLDQNAFENQSLVTVFDQNTSLNPTSWNSLDFTTPFSWDGTSNILVEISYSNKTSGTNNTVNSSTTGFVSGIHSGGTDNYLSFNGPDFVKFENASNIFDNVDEQITVSFWMNGDACGSTAK